MSTNSDTGRATDFGVGGSGGLGSLIAEVFTGTNQDTTVASTPTVASPGLGDTQHQDHKEQYIQYDDLSRTEQDMIVNVTREYPFDYAIVMFGYMMPFVLALTLISNTLVVMVLAQRHMRTPTNIVLFTMAIVDLMTLLSPSPWYFYIYTLGYYDKFLYPPIACYAHHIMTDVIPVFFHTSSIWLALLLASQRYIYVCHPTLARTWCTVPRVKRAIFVILFVALLHQLSRFFDVTFAPVHMQYEQGYQDACKISISEWVHRIDIAVYYMTYYIFRILFVFIIPCVALITLNYLLFRALKRAENKRAELLRTKFKFIGGNHCSMGVIDARDHSFTINNISKAQTGPAGEEIASTAVRTRRQSSIRVKRQSSFARSSKGTNGRGCESCKFSIASTLGKRASALMNSTGHQQANSNKMAAEAVTKQGTSMKPILSGNVSNNQSSARVPNGNRQTNNEVTLSKTKRIIHTTKLTRQVGSSDSCSVSSNQSKENSVAGEKTTPPKRNIITTLDGGGHVGAANEFGSSDDNHHCCNQEESTCAECTAYDHNEELMECHRCATTTNGGATGEDPDHNGIHREISQCSSLMGGATNETTNEDVSSCLVTQNASSSMYVAHDETLEALEAGSMRGDGIEDIEIDQENISLHNSKSLLTRAKMNEIGREKLSKSGSIDSRLACGCLPSKAPTIALRGMRLARQKQPCKECCRCQRRLTHSRSTSGQQSNKDGKCTASCSNSDPCINCYNSDCSSKNDINVNGACNEQAMLMEPVIPTSQSDYGNETSSDKNQPHQQGSDRKKHNGGRDLSNAPATTTTTTTTTLYSANTNSIGSLAQVQGTNTMLRKGSQRARARSPSYDLVSGRGSRSTLPEVQNIPIPLIVAGNTATTTSHVSLRSMDSNRTTLMLIVVVTVFLMVEVPVAIVTIFHVVLNTFDIFGDVEFDASLNYIKLFTNFFIMISYSVNFTIYCSMSKKFRETFRDLFMCGQRAKRKREQAFMYQQQSQYNAQPSNNQLIANNNATTIGYSGAIQNDFNTAISGLHHTNNHNNIGNANNGALRVACSQRKMNNQQQTECEL